MERVIKVGLWLMVLFLLPVPSVRAGKLCESPYVSFTQDKLAFTTNSGDTNYKWYDVGTNVQTGKQSGLRGLQAGEHYYRYNRTGSIPVGKWEVTYRRGHCLHDGYPASDDLYHGIPFKRQSCRNYYFSGWSATCADCNEVVVPMLMYMSKEAAASITELEMGIDYYYLCPHCNNLEQGAPLKGHSCKKNSWNRYLVVYKAARPKGESGEIAGYMENSIHMYNNATQYEGKEVTPDVRLRANAYSLQGYEFTGWNTEADGSGQAFADQEEILNLTEENYTNFSEGKGIVTLYAQWKKSSSTLQINPNGGTYMGSNNAWNQKQEYLSTYKIHMDRLTPPAGYTLSFDTQGGAPVKAITGTQSFREWKQSTAFRGILKENVYVYKGGNGERDTLTAQYDSKCIVLPSATKAGSSFGGWYFDKACHQLAGGAGEEIIPDHDMVLYAKWVDLCLKADDNYSVNKGAGAVDLWWSQQDGKSKTYLLYQSRDMQTWKQIAGEKDAGNTKSVKKEFVFSGKEESYVVPYTGIYEIRACGAQGGGYGSSIGGLGGQVQGKVWLTKGERLTVHVGGQNGYNGGGKASAYGNGGGYTAVKSDTQGLLLLAGGGGGAGESGRGGAGGSSASVMDGGRAENGMPGQNGMSGGGGGKQGGSGGEYIRHTHTSACYHTECFDYTLVEGDDCSPEYMAWWNGHKAGAGKIVEPLLLGAAARETRLQNRVEGWAPRPVHMELHPGLYRKGDYASLHDNPLASVSGWKQFDTRGNREIVFGFETLHWGNAWKDSPSVASVRLRVINQNGREIFAKEYANLPVFLHRQGLDSKEGEFNSYTGGTYGGGSAQLISIQPNNGGNRVARLLVNERITIPEGTTSVAFVLSVYYGEGSEGHYRAGINYIRFHGGTKTHIVCGYREGEVISSKPAYGGSNYVNEVAMKSYGQSSGVRAGNGLVALEALQVGYVESMSMRGVAAVDEAAPDCLEGYKKEANGKNEIKISWEEPSDQGTLYYHRVESYVRGSSVKQSDSNITRNTLTSGIDGYRYLVDGQKTTALSPKTGNFTRERVLTLGVTTRQQYLHLAAVDKAGNLSATLHIPFSSEDENLAWDILTGPLQMEGDEGNVYPAGQGTYYVKADGVTPFYMTFAGVMQGKARADYYLSEMNLECSGAGELWQRYRIAPKGMKRQEEEHVIKDLTRSAEGRDILRNGNRGEITESESGGKMKLNHGFTLAASHHGVRLRVWPQAGALRGRELVYSDRSRDEKNGIVIVGDSEPPIIKGDDQLKGMEKLNRNKETVSLELKAEDLLSGVREFRVVIQNRDNQITDTRLPEADGTIRINITEDVPVFSGDFTLAVEAVDHVGNVSRRSYEIREFSLRASVHRSKEPHEPVFKRGESGILRIVTHGYADRLEILFPEEMTQANPGLNRVIDYGDRPAYIQEEELEFVIPLPMESGGKMQIMVRAFKGEEELEDTPAISLIEVEGTILKEVRTRLR